ncbi:hypothetical protein ACBQ20_08770 [Proteus vulgaris]|uniref:hypothetical protein n=1 Tax=Proteus vulgaris TaxID=585 RepID=UPI0035262591
MALCDSPYRDRVLTEEQKEDCSYCDHCDVEILDDDVVFVGGDTVYCCEQCFIDSQ